MGNISSAFFHFYNKLCELLNRELSPEVEAMTLKLFDDIYAGNPDKTTDKRFLDEDLWAALHYVENDQKTDQTMYV